MVGDDTASTRLGSLAPVAAAVALVVAATLLGALTWDGDGLVIPGAWLLAAVLGAAVLGGLTGGLTATLGAALAIVLVFSEPRWSLAMDEPREVRAAAALAALCLLITLAVDAIDSARRRADRSLVEQQEAVALLDAVLEHAPVGIAFFDTDLRFVRVNEALLEMNGLPVADHLGRRVGEALGDPSIEDVVRRVLATGRPALDVRFGGTHRATGRELHVVASYYPVRDALGRVAGVGAVVHDTTGNVLAERERELLFQRLARLQSVTEALAAARTTDEIVTAVLAEVRQATGAVAASLVLADDRELRILGSDGYDGPVVETWRRFPVDAPIPLAEAVRTGRIVTAGDRADIVRRWPATADSIPPGERAIAALPLHVDGTPRGGIGLSIAADRSWGDEERRFLEAIASQCSQALERAMLTDSERYARERVTFLAGATAELSATLDLDETLARLTALAVPQLGDTCTVFLVEADGTRPVAHASVDPAKGHELRRHLERWPLEAVARTGEAELHTDDAVEGAGLSSLLLVPMRTTQGVVGVLALGTSGQRRLGDEELALATEIGTRAAQAVLNARLFRDRAHVADVLQRSLLPPSTAAIPGVDVATRFVPVGEGIDVGGDFFDVFRLGRPRRASESWAVLIGDVRGKGAEAAAITAAARHAVRAAGLHSRSPAALLAELNEVLLVLGEQTDADDMEPMFCTAAVATVTPTGTGVRVVVGVGGHPLPLLLHADGTTTTVGEPGSLLGVVDDPLLQDVEIDLRPGEAIVLYTDGVTERHAGDRFFDEEGLAAAVARCAGFTADALAERIELAARAFVEDEPVDDMAIVVVRAPTRTGTSASASTDLPVDSNAPRLARRFVTEVLGAIGRHDLVDTGTLLTSELVTNAVLHGSPPLRVSVEPRDGHVRVAVADGSEGVPRVVESSPDALHGRGMQLVEQVAARWGVDQAAGGVGKAVWFDLA